MEICGQLYKIRRDLAQASEATLLSLFVELNVLVFQPIYESTFPVLLCSELVYPSSTFVIKI